MDHGAAGRSSQAAASAAPEVAGRGENAGRDRRVHDVLIDPDTGEPRVFYHGASDDVTAFDLNHPNRKDAGWLGRGVYVASVPRVANSYAILKGGDSYPKVMQKNNKAPEYRVLIFIFSGLDRAWRRLPIMQAS